MRPLNVLLIDDDEDDRDVFTSAIAMMPGKHKCIALEDAGTALKKLEEKLLTPDVIFLDLNMPKMDGKNFFLKIKSRQDLNHIPIVIFSTVSYRESVKSDELYKSDFISKPDSFRELRTILENYFGTHFNQLDVAV